MDPDAVWDGEWGRSNDGCITWVVIVEGEGAVLGVNLGHPTVTINQWGLCWIVVQERRALLKLL